jgi:hypothetical protein
LVLSSGERIIVDRLSIASHVGAVKGGWACATKEILRWSGIRQQQAVHPCSCHALGFSTSIGTNTKERVIMFRRFRIATIAVLTILVGTVPLALQTPAALAATLNVCGHCTYTTIQGALTSIFHYEDADRCRTVPRGVWHAARGCMAG